MAEIFIGGVVFMGTSSFYKMTKMKKSIQFTLPIGMVFCLCMLLTSCQAIADIFGAGVYTGVFLVVLFIGIIIALVARVRRK